ncbi:MAG: ComEA family DNA-binding protein [Candidatus Levybacteria bacterium]|nr:ComEA family DNA-binding protein [Candidatus Levybacteria bacterium]
MKNQTKKDTENGNIVVDVSGGVLAPGVYRLSDNARVEDALHAAGGFSSDADLDWTQHSLNLAAKVTDGMKIYIPRIGEEMQSVTESNSAAAGGGTTMGVAGVSTNGMVSINSASSSELEALPGIGPVTAGKIIDNRPYGSIDELLSKKAVGKSVYEKIKELVSL